MKIIDFFKKNKIALQGKTLILAVSGGPDSVALMDMMSELREKYDLHLVIAHFDHQLRPDSQQETRLVRRFCQTRGLIFANGVWAKDEQPQSGLEAAARHFRYAFLIKIVAKYHGDYLLTAHHNDDLLENILLKFIRSGNPSEMNSLQAVGKMGKVTLLRPLLAYSKQELLTYDLKKHLAFVQDSTNLRDDTLRNRLRHHVIPLLKKENPRLGQNALRFCRQMNLLHSLTQAKLAEIKGPQAFLDVSYRLAAKKLDSLSAAEKKYFWQQFIWRHYSKRVNSDLGDYFLLLYQGYFYLIPAELHASEVFKPIQEECVFAFAGRRFLLSRQKKDYLTRLGSFWAHPQEFYAGNLPVGSKLKLKNGQHVKAKKMFAQAGIPNRLRGFCLTIFNRDQEPIWVEKTYQDQSWQENGCKYFIYLLKKYKN